MSQRDTFPYRGNRADTTAFQHNAGVSAAGEPFLANFAPSLTSNTQDDQASSIYHGEALARDTQLERYGGWTVLVFTVAFALFLLIMNAAGQAPGQSFPLKSISDILQFAGESIGLFFVVRITLRLRNVSMQLSRALRQLEEEGQHSRNELVAARNEAQAAQRAYLAWVLLALGVALYASGQAIWTSYDVRMPSSQVPFPGIYDIGFVGSYPFFLSGTLLLTRRNRAAAGRLRLLLDALAVIGAALALSWFFVLRPSIAGLAQAPSPGAAFLSIYFPSGDLLLVAVGAFLMFSPLSTREQQPVFVRLCLGLFFLAVTDSLLGYFSLSPSGFNTGTLQDTLWPLSMSCIGLAAIAYPQSVAHEQERVASPIALSQLSQLTLALQLVAPFILALGTCALLLTVVPTLGGKSLLIQASLIALTLFLLVSIRQALTLQENNRLRLQQAGELVLSRRELQVKSRQADDAERTAQEKERLEQGVRALQEVISHLANGDFSVRAPADGGPLQEVAISFNLLIDRLNELARRAVRYENIIRESTALQEALDRLGRGVTAWSPISATPNSRSELRPLFFGLQRLQLAQLTQWRSLLVALERALAPLTRLRAALGTSEEGGERSGGTTPGDGSNSLLPGWTDRSLEQLEQQLRSLIAQTNAVIERLDGQPPQQAFPTQSGAYQNGQEMRPHQAHRAWPHQGAQMDQRSSYGLSGKWRAHDRTS